MAPYDYVIVGAGLKLSQDEDEECRAGPMHGQTHRQRFRTS
jgi:hypothetical protein